MTRRKEKSAYREKKKLLTVQRKKCLPRRENFAYQAEKKLLTAGCKISLPRTLIDIKYSDILQYYLHFINEENLSIATVDNIHTLLHPTFQMAVRDDIIRKNPTDGVMADFSLTI